MYRQLGMRAALFGASASGTAGSVGVHHHLPPPLGFLLALAAGGLTLYLAVSLSLLVVALTFRLHHRWSGASAPTPVPWNAERGVPL